MARNAGAILLVTLLLVIPTSAARPQAEVEAASAKTLLGAPPPPASALRVTTSEAQNATTTALERLHMAESAAGQVDPKILKDDVEPFVAAKSPFEARDHLMSLAAARLPSPVAPVPTIQDLARNLTLRPISPVATSADVSPAPADASTITPPTLWPDEQDPAPQPHDGQTVWINDSHMTTHGMYIRPNATLILQNSTLTVYPGLQCLECWDEQARTTVYFYQNPSRAARYSWQDHGCTMIGFYCEWMEIIDGSTWYVGAALYWDPNPSISLDPTAKLILINSSIVASRVTEPHLCKISDWRYQSGNDIWDNCWPNPWNNQTNVMWNFDSDGTIIASNSTFDGASGLANTPPGEAVAITNSLFHDSPGTVELQGVNASIDHSLFYNFSRRAAVQLGDDASLTNSTLINNDIGILTTGARTKAMWNVLRFNLVGTYWYGGPNVTIQQNNIYDNYVDGFFGTPQDPTTGQTADAPNNWWDGNPNGDGDSWGGVGVSVSSYSPTPFALPDRTAEIPFALHSFKGSQTYAPQGQLDGPVIARFGTLTIDAEGPLDVHQYRLGSHLGGALDLVNTNVQDYGMLLSRSNDVFDNITLNESGRGSAWVPTGSGIDGGMGLLVIEGTPTLRNSRISNVTYPVLQSAIFLTDPPVVFVVQNNVFYDDGGIVTAVIGNPTFVGNTVLRSGYGVGCVISDCILQSNTIQDTSVALLGALGGKPTFVGNTIQRCGLALTSILMASVHLQQNLVQDCDIGILDALSQGFASSGDGVYNSTFAAMYFALTSGPTVSGYEGRFNQLNILSVGSQVSITRSNLYDDPLFETLLLGIVVSGAAAPATLTADSTTYIGGPTRAWNGAITYTGPPPTGPVITGGRTATYPATIIGAGQVGIFTGNVTINNPVIARAGGAIIIRNATVDLRSVLGTLPGAAMVVDNSTLRGSSTFVSHSQGTVIKNSHVLTELQLAEDATTLVQDTSFWVDGGTPLLEDWMGGGLIDHNSFAGGSPADNVQIALRLVNYSSTTPPLMTVTRNQFFYAGYSFLSSDSFAIVHNNSFVSDSERLLEGYHYGSGWKVDHGIQGAPMDLRYNWFGDAGGPAYYDSDGNVVGQGELVQCACLLDPWLTAPYRAEFTLPDRGIQDAPVLFLDTTNHADGVGLDEEWDLGDGTVASNPGATFAHTYSAPGTYTATLTVTDERGTTSVASHDVTIRALPVAVLAPADRALSGVPIVLNASASFAPSGTLSGYRFGADDGYDSGWVSSPVAQHAFQTPGAHGVTLTVRDSNGLSSLPTTQSVLVDDRAPNLTIIIGTPVVTRLWTTNISASASDPDGSVVNITWSLDDSAQTLWGPSITPVFTTLGPHTLSAQAIDNNGSSTTATTTVTVVNLAPSLTVTPSSAVADPGSAITFSAIGIDPEGTSVTITWASSDGAVGTGSTFTHAFQTEGNYTVHVLATDAEGASSAMDVPITIHKNLPPVAKIASGCSSTPTGTSIFLRDGSSDPDGRVVAWRWDFGDGTNSSLRNVAHTYLNPGNFTIVLSVTDDRGSTTSIQCLTSQTPAMTMVIAHTSSSSATSPQVLTVRTRWTNGTAAASFGNVSIDYQDPVLHRSVHYADLSYSTNSDGFASVTVPSQAGVSPPGTYVAVAVGGSTTIPPVVATSRTTYTVTPT